MSRAIDALIAEHVFGCVITRSKHTDELMTCFDKDIGNVPLLNYSTQIQDAWLVVEKMREKLKWSFSLDTFYRKKNYFCRFEKLNDEGFPHTSYDEVNQSAPLAICLAALKALNVEIPDV